MWSALASLDSISLAIHRPDFLKGPQPVLERVLKAALLALAPAPRFRSVRLSHVRLPSRGSGFGSGVLAKIGPVDGGIKVFAACVAIAESLDGWAVLCGDAAAADVVIDRMARDFEKGGDGNYTAHRLDHTP